MRSTVVHLPAHYYQQFDADYHLDVPAEGFGGWQSCELPLDLERTALVVMHAWDYGDQAAHPGWRRVVEYIPRAESICREVFPGLLSVVRSSPMQVFHVVGGGDYYHDYPGYARALELSGPSPEPQPQIYPGTVYQSLKDFRSEAVYVGRHNQADVDNGFRQLDFPQEARPVGDEGIAENAHQLFGLCRDHGIDHLIYVGFAINWCLLLSPGGMNDMRRHGLLCSCIAEAVTAVENKETAATEAGKENALWRVALEFGFVYHLDDILDVLR